jgi:hypothetical protein
VVGTSALGAEKCGDVGAEERGESRAEWVSFGGCRGKRRDGFSHGLTLQQGHAWGGGCMHHAWSRRGGRSAAPT